MNNYEFLEVLKQSFLVYLRTGARSNEKLKVLHGAISKDIHNRLNDRQYAISSLGYGAGKEKTIDGKYINKAVDITISEKGKAIAGIAVKFVMSNYSQNSNNYFENMLGETANIRSAQIPYFQIFVIPDIIPYFDRSGNITKWETISAHNLDKYIKLSYDNIDNYMHTPNKTLVYIIHLESTKIADIRTKDEYEDVYLNNSFVVRKSDLRFSFGNTIIYNDYEKFAEKTVYAIKSI
ncbi:MAG: hypothetical protein IJP20_00920 [Clostridia bacterium]|nr:hypothetical protein [Clostridia bacterium]